LPLLVSVSLLLVTGCGVNPLSLLTGGGPNVAANTVIGKDVVQGVSISTAAPSVSIEPNARVDKVDQSATTNNTNSILLIIIAILGWLAPSPNEIAREIKAVFKRSK